MIALSTTTTLYTCSGYEMVTKTTIKKKPVAKPKEDLPDVEVSSPWFKIKLDKVNFKVILVVGMILIAMVVIAKILV